MSVPGLVFACVGILAAAYFVYRTLRRRRVERTGAVVAATVVSVDQTRTAVNSQYLMRITVDYATAAGGTHRASLLTTIPPGTSVTAGSAFPIVVDPADPDNIYLPDDAAIARTGGVAVLAQQALESKVLAGVASNRRDKVLDALHHAQSDARVLGQLGPTAVADVVAIRALADGTPSIECRLVRIARPRPTIFCNQTFAEGEMYFTVGDRVYVQLDANEPPLHGMVKPLSYSRGVMIPNTGNRMDGSIVAGELQQYGSTAHGTVLAAGERHDLAAVFVDMGTTSWDVTLHVVPDDGSAPYDGVTRHTVSTAEKAHQITAIGAVLPLRYDPDDRATFRIDSFAMGWGDPTKTLEKYREAGEAAGLF